MACLESFLAEETLEDWGWERSSFFCLWMLINLLRRDFIFCSDSSLNMAFILGLMPPDPFEALLLGTTLLKSSWAWVGRVYSLSEGSFWLTWILLITLGFLLAGVKLQF